MRTGDSRTFELAYTGDGHLVVTVLGTFGGEPRSRVHTVQLGTPAPVEGGERRQTTDDGVKVKLKSAQ